MSPKNTKKSSNRHGLCCRRFGLSLGRTFGLCHCLEFYGPWNYCGRPLWCGGRFLWGWDCWAYKPQQETRPESNKLRKKILTHWSLPNNSINSLVSKCLNDNVVTGREFQIINAELEKYF